MYFGWFKKGIMDSSVKLKTNATSFPFGYLKFNCFTVSYFLTIGPDFPNGMLKLCYSI